MRSTASQKASKGSVGVESVQNRLRLRLPRELFGGKQKYLTLGLSDTPANQKLAEAKAKQIESDITFERFDSTLEKYKPAHKRKAAKNSDERVQTLTVGELWQKYVEYRKPQVSPTTVANQYSAVSSHISKLPTQKLADAVEMRNWFVANLTLDSAKRTLMQLNACCHWAQKSKLIKENPFSGMASEIKVSRCREDIQPFNREEQQAIIEAFQETQYDALIRFLFLTGCRTGEALGFKSKYIDSKFRFIIFAESRSGQQGFTTDTKTHKSRKLPCNRQLQALLKANKPKSLDPEALVFDIGSVRTFQDNWQRIVKRLVAEGKVDSYRSQYTTRHTFITNCLESGVNVVQIAKFVGNSPQVILEHYAGIIQQVQIPEF